MTHRESKAISDRINRKADKDRLTRHLIATIGFMSMDTLELTLEAKQSAAKEAQMMSSILSRELKKRRRLEAKKLTGSGDDRRTRIADGPETSGHVEASPAVDGVRVDGSDGRRRSSDRT